MAVPDTNEPADLGQPGNGRGAVQPELTPKARSFLRRMTAATGGGMFIDGFVFATSAGSSLSSARSLYWQVSASFSPAACMRIHEL